MVNVRVISALVWATLISLPAEAQLSKVKTVFVIAMENHNWNQFKGAANAPYLNNTLLPQASYAEQYYNPPGLHPSLPNYFWREAGTTFGVVNDNDPASNHQSTTAHLVTQLKNAGISWKTYQEDISGTNCPLTSVNLYAPKHNAFVYFDDVTNTNDPNSAYCIAHMRPLTELVTDLQTNTVAQYVFITPNLCNDGHDSCAPVNDGVRQTDNWFAAYMPAILNSTAYQNGGAVFITWDEGEGGDGPIGMIVLSPQAKGGGYSNSIHYTHGSLLRTVEEIFGVSLLGDAALQSDLSDLFMPAPVGESFLSATAPANCGTPDYAIVTAATLYGSGSGFGCLKTLILPQFAAGNGWNSQLNLMMPVQPNTAGLVNGTVPAFAFQWSLGSGATATLPGDNTPILIQGAQNGCLGLWSSNSRAAAKADGGVIGSGRADHLDFIGLGSIGACTGGADARIDGLGQGPMQVQMIAPNASALSQATVLLSYYYQDANFNWQVTVNPVDFTSAKRTWTAPLYQGGDYVTAFTVVNVSNVAQTVNVTLRDGTGGGIVSKTTPLIAAGCGCNVWQQSAAGGYYAGIVPNLFPGISAKTGSIEFTGNSGNIVVLVLRTIKNTLGSVPAN